MSVRVWLCSGLWLNDRWWILKPSLYQNCFDIAQRSPWKQNGVMEPMPQKSEKWSYFPQFSRTVIQRLSHPVPCLQSWLWQLIGETNLFGNLITCFTVFKYCCCTILFLKPLSMGGEILPIFRLVFQVMIHVHHSEEQNRDNKIPGI